MPECDPLIGKRIGFWTIKQQVWHTRNHDVPDYLVQCLCGHEYVVKKFRLKKLTSCKNCAGQLKTKVYDD